MKGWMRNVRSVVVLVVALSVASVQVLLARQRDTPSFEAASVKANPLRSGVRGHSFPGDRFVASNVPLADLIQVAYGRPGQLLPYHLVTGLPGWADTERFDITATVQSVTGNGIAEKQLMLRSLLAERFKLAVRWEKRSQPVYVLALTRSDGTLGKQLRRSDGECEALLGGQPRGPENCILYALPSGQLTMRRQSIGSLANLLSMTLNRTVQDRTGLSGGFDGDAEFDAEGLPGMSQGGNQNRPDDRPSLVTALREQFGLKLESANGEVDVLVVVGVVRSTEN